MCPACCTLCPNLQVRREALLTLTALVNAVVPPPAPDMPSTSAAAGAPQADAAATPSGALEALAALRARLLEAADGTRHDGVPAVRAASVEARAAAMRLPGPPGGSPGAAPDAEASPPPSRRSTPRRSPLRRPAAASGAGPAVEAAPSGGLAVRVAPPRFRRPEGAPEEFLDFGVQVFAPPSPPPRRGRGSPGAEGDASPARASDQDTQAASGGGSAAVFYPSPDYGGPRSLRRSIDAASQTGEAAPGSPGWPSATSSPQPQWLRHVLQSGAEALMGASPGSPGGAAGSAAGSAGWGMDHRFTGRVEIVVGSPAEVEAAAEQQRARASAAGGGLFPEGVSACSGSPHSPYRGHVATASRDGSPLRPRPAAPPPPHYPGSPHNPVAQSQNTGFLPEPSAQPPAAEPQLRAAPELPPPPGAAAGSPVADVVARVLRRVLPGGPGGSLGVDSQTQAELLRLGQAVLRATGQAGDDGAHEHAVASMPPQAGAADQEAAYCSAAALLSGEGANSGQSSQLSSQPGSLPSGGPSSAPTGIAPPGGSLPSSLAPSRASSRAGLAGALSAVRRASSRVGGLLEELSVAGGIGALPVPAPATGYGSSGGSDGAGIQDGALYHSGSAAAASSSESMAPAGAFDAAEQPVGMAAAPPESPALAAAITSALPQLHSLLGLLQQPFGGADQGQGVPMGVPQTSDGPVPASGQGTPATSSRANSLPRGSLNGTPSQRRLQQPHGTEHEAHEVTVLQLQEGPAHVAAVDPVDGEGPQEQEGVGEPQGRHHQRRQWQPWDATEEQRQQQQPGQHLVWQEQPQPGVRVSVERHDILQPPQQQPEHEEDADEEVAEDDDEEEELHLQQASQWLSRPQGEQQRQQQQRPQQQGEMEQQPWESLGGSCLHPIKGTTGAGAPSPRRRGLLRPLSSPGPGRWAALDPAAHAAAVARAAWTGAGVEAESSEGADLLMALSWRLQRLARGFGQRGSWSGEGEGEGEGEAPESVGTPSPSMARARFPAGGARAGAGGGRSPPRRVASSPSVAARGGGAQEARWLSHEEDERLAQQVPLSQAGAEGMHAQQPGAAGAH
jgi:hypothetical protein